MERELRLPSDALERVRPVILVVDDDAALRESFRLVLEDTYDVLDVPDGRQAIEVVSSRQVDLVLLDVRLPEMDGIEVLERIKSVDDGIEVVLVTAVRTVRTAVAAMKLGAFDYVTKPFEEEELLAVVRRALGSRALEREVTFLRSEIARRHDEDTLVGQHPEMQRLYRLIGQVARTTATVLVTGESGTGKELIARAIHAQGPRRDKPFVAVNPAALSPTLVESELFGHERGAFTGAFQRKLGRFELVQGGTLFLDEIGNIPADLQAKLLRVLQEREIERVGGSQRIRIDARIIAATNGDLKQAVAGQTFREDLYYRLNVIPIAVPPLRERREDLPALVEHFVQRYSRQFNRRVTGMTPEALAILQDYPWPGNVRELQNLVERLVALVEGPLIGLGDLPLEFMLPDHRARGQRSDAVPLRRATEEFERQIVLRVLERVRWNRSEAARLLGIHRNSLKTMLARWKLTGPGGADLPNDGSD